MAEQVSKPADVQVQPKVVTGSPLRIEFNKSGTVPPVFVAGTFTSWQPVELTATSDKPEEAHFYHEFSNIGDGEHHYKFKLGTEGDWWTTDEQVMTMTDDQGNKNNIITVKKDMTTASPGTSMDTVANIQSTKPVEVHNEQALTEKPSSAAPQDAAPVEKADKQMATNAGSTLIADTPPNQAANITANIAEIASKIDQTPAKTTEDTGPAPQDAAPVVKADTQMATNAGSTLKADTPPKQVANTAAEVADTASKLDQAPVKKTEEPAPAPIEAIKDTASKLEQTLVKKTEKPAPAPIEAIKEGSSKLADAVLPSGVDQGPTKKTEEPAPAPIEAIKEGSRKLADAVLPSANTFASVFTSSASSAIDQVAPKKAVNESKKTDDKLTSPAVPPAPAVTPVASSPPLEPARPVQHEAQLPPTPASPLKSLDAAISYNEMKPSRQEMAVAPPPPSTPAKASQDAALPAYIKTDQTTPAAAANIPLPASPAVDQKPAVQFQEVSDSKQSGAFPQDDLKLVRRPTTFRERSVSIIDTFMAIPNMIMALFLSIINAFTDYLDKVFNPQRGAQNDKSSKSD